jgi:hypothetical protein
MDGDWGPDLWSDSTGTTANNGPQVQAQDVLTQSTVTSGQDRWTGFLQNLIGDVAKYAVNRDAAQSGLIPARAANGQTVYAPAAQPVTAAGNMTSTYLVIGGIVAVVVLVAVSSKG